MPLTMEHHNRISHDVGWQPPMGLSMRSELGLPGFLTFAAKATAGAVKLGSEDIHILCHLSAVLLPYGKVWVQDWIQ